MKSFQRQSSSLCFQHKLQSSIMVLQNSAISELRWITNTWVQTHFSPHGQWISHGSFELVPANASASSHHRFFVQLPIFIKRKFRYQCTTLCRSTWWYLATTIAPILCFFSVKLSWNSETVEFNWRDQDSEARPHTNTSVAWKALSRKHLQQQQTWGWLLGLAS